LKTEKWVADVGRDVPLTWTWGRLLARQELGLGERRALYRWREWSNAGTEKGATAPKLVNCARPHRSEFVNHKACEQRYDRRHLGVERVEPNRL
jgi:hypothetical protein